ncbi:zinc finger protein 687-like isoform X2 [Rhincodon typus]|nr:zinc finger protein 687-like isoform X2 [Rhincodon typus]XP_048476398.1 zinc finger protein 687-like isoform X2 [Rhincodon typus]XP_048476399.1 zinc finger protein 687-like isoform X2 [Rhincodon typus]XP_048476400.1 zinc finger protein 687-like isoform X2 [Rhincodon typus]
MGEMTTPDFDDLLAAFDIPDLDPQGTIDSSQEEAPLKQAASGKGPSTELAVSLPDEPAVSVIVKNSVSPKRSPSHRKEAHRFDPGALHNGYEATPNPGSPKPALQAAGCEGWPKVARAEGLPPFEPLGRTQDPPVKTEEEEGEREAAPFLPRTPLFPVPPASEDPRAYGLQGEDQTRANGAVRSSSEDDELELEEEEEEEERQSDVESEEMEQSSDQENSLPDVPRGDSSTFAAPKSPAALWTDPGADSSVAGHAGVKSPEGEEETQPPSPPVPSATGEGSPCGLPSPPGLSRQLKQQQEADSPQSVTSDDSSSKGSSSSSSSRPLKVRIKTIKTSSGGIMRTVTRVSSDSEPRPDQTDGTAPDGETEPMEEGEEEEDEEEEERGGEQLLPEAEVPAPAPGHGDGPEVVSLQLGNGAVVKGTVLPTSTFQNASTAMLMAASIAQKATLAPPKPNAAAAKPVSKSVHLASLNLVPQTLPAATTTRPLALAPKSATTTTSSTTTTLQLATKSPSNGAGAQKTGQGTPRSPAAPLVEAFHKLLNGRNPLPTYKPNLNPPAESCLALPPSGYRCLECGDSFALEKSLARHYDRRSMRIDVTCNHCAKRIVFFNRCSLMLHAREHKDKGLVMQCSNLVMKTISLEQMIGQPDVAPVLPASRPRSAAVDAGSQQNSPVMPLFPDPALINCSNFNCAECDLPFANQLELALHFQVGAPSSSSTAATAAAATAQVCQLCQMLLPTKCSYFAHYRLHKSKSPYICPECGGVCRAAHIQNHVKDVCFHYARKVGYKCPQCGVVYGGVTSIKSHIQDVHCEAFHKCPICPMAFKSAPSAHSHIYTQHPGVSNQQAKVIHKCAMCDTVFTHQPLLSSHFDQHLTKQRVNVFKCPQCPVLYAQKRTMMEHIKSTHSNLKSEDVAPSWTVPPDKGTVKSSPDSTDVSTDESSTSSKTVLTLQRRKEMRLKLKNAGWTCGQCQMWFPEREEYVTHMKKDHGKAMKKFPCRLCERSFCSAPSLRRHVRVNHEGIKRVYSCRHCSEGKRTFSSRLTLEKHLQVIHGINMADHAQDQENLFERVSIKTTIRKRPSSRDGPEHWGSEGAKSRKLNGSSTFRCMKCGQTCSSFSDFHKHIGQHRTGASSFQCRHCGLCFAAQLSLNRHLFIVHGLKESEGAKGTEDKGEAEWMKLEGGVICDVCGKLFESVPLLKTHFRTHGMAFIKSKQNGLDK